MKPPAVDYRNFRPAKLNDPQYSHLKLLSGWIFYFSAYFLTENLIPPESCHVIWCPLDDRIPFCEAFVIPYVFWYFLVFGSLLYFGLYHVQSFRNLQTYILITQILAVAVYILYPSRQDLRPENFPRENLLTDAVALLYTVDTNTGVCPSLHVAYSLGLGSVWLREKGIPNWFKGTMVLLVILICLSTLFIKQHSAVDVLAALPVCLIAEYLVFYRKKRKNP